MVCNNCALYMLLYKQCRGFYRCSKRVHSKREVCVPRTPSSYYFIITEQKAFTLSPSDSPWSGGAVSLWSGGGVRSRLSGSECQLRCLVLWRRGLLLRLLHRDEAGELDEGEVELPLLL